MDTRVAAFKLYSPLLFFVVFLALALTLGMVPSILGTIKPSVGVGIFSLSVPITNTWAVRLSLVVMGVWSLSAYLFYDYSKFFPSHLKYDVYLDEEHIYKALALIPAESLAGLQIPSDAETQRQTWMRDTDEGLAVWTSLSDPFLALGGDNIHGSGWAEFAMEKVSGFQTYKITKSYGYLTTELALPGHAPRPVNSRFDKVDSPYDTVILSARDFFVRRGTTLRTRYAQSLQSHTKELSKFEVVALTPVTIFPWPRIGKTVYLVMDDKNKTTAIPVGFAVYKYK